MNTQIVLAGVGGQGILFAARVLSHLGLQLGLDVMGSETHGMSQRGGSVVAHVKLGTYKSPLIRAGEADVLYSFHAMETYRNLRFLRPGGLCFVNLTRIDRFDDEILDHLKKKDIAFRNCDATGIALKMGSKRSANIALIGYSAGTGLLPFQSDDLKNVLESISGEKDAPENIMAFEFGFEAAKSEGNR
jgi:indolepyruvate ferredoxin oxidoreductase beta subunit